MTESDLVPLLKKLIRKPFPSMKGLVKAVKAIGVPGLDGFGNGGRNEKLAKEQLNRYVKVCKMTEIDSTCKKSNACTIIEVFDPPQPKKDGRGKKGSYINCIKPLVLNLGDFKGKIYELCNRWGLFYEFELRQAGKNPIALSQVEYGTYNPWKVDMDMSPGEIKYRTCLNYQINDRIKYALTSLEKEEKLTWSEFTMFIPDIKYEATSNTISRLKTWNELKAECAKRKQLVELISSEENCVLSPDLLIATNMTHSCYSNMSYQEYNDRYCQNDQCLFPLQTTEYEKQIYQNYQLFLRQLVCSIQMKSDKYLKIEDIEDITNEYRFYSDWQRRLLYIDLDNELRPILLGWKTAWKEIEFHVYDDKKENILPKTVTSYVETLEKLYTKFMADKMENNKETFKSNLKHLDDCYVPFGKPRAYHLYPLSRSFAARDIQKQLNDLYPTTK